MNPWFDISNEVNWQSIFSEPPDVIAQRIPRPTTPFPVDFGTATLLNGIREQNNNQVNSKYSQAMKNR